MQIHAAGALASKPRWDGRRLLFTLEIDGGEVSCAISRDALQVLGGGRFVRNGDLLGSFAQSRKRITEIAVEMLRTRPESITGTVSIWADDIDEPPAAPAVAAQAAGHADA